MLHSHRSFAFTKSALYLSYVMVDSDNIDNEGNGIEMHGQLVFWSRSDNNFDIGIPEPLAASALSGTASESPLRKKRKKTSWI